MSAIAEPLEPIYSALGGDPDLGEIVVLFVDEMPERIAAFEEHLAAERWEDLRRTAHQLKGAAGSYGFAPISPLAGDVENAIRGGQAPEKIAGLVAKLIAVCRAARAGAPA